MSQTLSTETGQSSILPQLWRWGLVILLPLLAGLWTWHAGFDPKIVAFSSITLTALILWALELLPDAVVALALPVVYILCGVGPNTKILGPWTGSIGWLILGGLMIGAFMVKTGLARRLALSCINLMGGSLSRLLAGLLLSGLLMAPFIPSVMGRSAIIAVICVGICEALSIKKGSREGAAVLLAGFIAVSGPKICFLTGGADLAMGMKLTSQAMGAQISWGQYALHNFLPAVLYSVISLACVIVLLRPRLEEDTRTVVQEQLRKLAPMSNDERKSAFLLALLFLFLVTDKIHRIDVGWIMLLLPCAAFLPGVRLLNSDDMRKLNYPAVLFAVGCMTIGSAAMSCGMDNILSKALLPLMQGTEFYTVMATYVSGVLLNLLLTPMAAYASLTASVVEIAQHLQVSPLLLVYTFSYGLDQYIFPYEYAILLYFYATGYIRIKQIMLVLGIRMALAALFVAFVAYPYWKLFL